MTAARRTLQLLHLALLAAGQTKVSCGGHEAASCAQCVQENVAMEDAPLFCNGDCTWTGTACAEKAPQPADKDEDSGGVSCGSHRAADCSQCPQGHGDGWCHGDCLWLHEACVLATPEHRAAAEKEHQKLQSIPRLRSFQRLGPELGGAQGPVRRSEPEPAAEDLYTNHVRNLVGTTVAGVIQEPGKDVLVNCFAPWCGHCQRFKPRYQELAKKLSHVQSLVVSQMDCTQNDLGPLRRVVRGYPTIALFPDGRKEDIQLYVGNRSPEDMTKWLNTKVTHAFSDTAPEPPKSEGDSGLLNDDDSNDL